MNDQEKSDKLDDYYQSCAFPKPKPAGKAKKKVNGYKDKPNRYCHYCGKRYAERHEISTMVSRWMCAGSIMSSCRGMCPNGPKRKTSGGSCITRRYTRTD